MITLENNTKSNKLRKVLAIDDSLTYLALLKAHLQKMGLSAMTTHDAGRGIEMAFNERPDLILLDVMMPEIDGFEVCRRLKADVRTSSIPVIFISANEQSKDKAAGLELGAVDYITKPFDPGELRARVGIILKMTELQEKLLLLANTDELTGLANRRYFFDILEREILQSKIKSNDLSLMILDLDHFKNVNDTYGHQAGDMILKQTGKIIRENTYPLDLAVRYGGEEFIVLMSETSTSKAARAAEKLCRIISNHRWAISNELISITASIGLAGINSHNLLDSGDLLKNADTALYVAKKRGRNCVVTWDKINHNQDVKIQENREYRELQAKLALLAKKLSSHALGTISAFTETINAVIKDKHVVQHARNVQVYAVAIAEEMGLSTELRERIDTAAFLHDLGKISVPDAILKKTTPLTEGDWKIIRQHPIVGARILAPLKIFDLELSIVRHHHENCDGTGYPDGLKGREIPIGARVLSVADVFDAATSDRPYHLAKSSEDALREIDNCSGSKFDPDVVIAFHRACEKHKEDWPLAAEKCVVEAV